MILLTNFMPIRQIPLVTNEFYHVINRGVGAIPIFKAKYDYNRFLQTMSYYQIANQPLKFSQWLELNQSDRQNVLAKAKKKQLQVEIVAYCLMPNHYHFLLKQTGNNGLHNFIKRLNNSYAHYFNIKYNRPGSLFEGRFKVVRVTNDEQLLHLSRYIHLNPYSAYIVKNKQALVAYPFSSLSEYFVHTKTNICRKNIILDQFSSPANYQKFVLDQADFQRNLELIKHLILD